MKTIATPAVFVFATLISACLGQPDPNGPAPTASASASASPVVSKAALDVEQAIRDVDLGRALAEARTVLETGIADASLSEDLRDEATLALARCRDTLGDREGAIATVEGLLEKRVDKHPWRHDEAADSLLQKLVTGSVIKKTRNDDANAKVAPFARALTPFFPVREGAVHVDMVQFGAAQEPDELGTFAVVEAVRAKAREACPLCEDSLNGHSSFSRHGSWTSIPAEKARLERALVVYFFDLERHRVPARYDALLPMPSAEVIARLEKGEGLVVVKSRPAAPPVILLGAPREAQMPDVQKALAAMTELPASPVSVSVAPGLRPTEIKAVVRAARGAMKTCVEKHSPKADGTIELDLHVREDGTVEAPSVKAKGEGVSEPALIGCLEKVASGLQFAKTGQKVRVTYPLRISP